MSDFDEAFSKEFHQSAMETHNDSIGVRNWNMKDIQPDQDLIIQTKKTNSRLSMVYKIIGGLAFCSITIIGIIKYGNTINPSSSTSRQTLRDKWGVSASPIKAEDCVKFIQTYEVKVQDETSIKLPVGTKATVKHVFGEGGSNPDYQITIPKKGLSVMYRSMDGNGDSRPVDIDNMFLYPYASNADSTEKWNKKEITLPLRNKGDKISAKYVKPCDEYDEWLAKNIDVLQGTEHAMVKNELKTKGWIKKEDAAKGKDGSTLVDIKAGEKVTVVMKDGLNNDDNIIKFKNYHLAQGDSDIFMKVNSDELSLIKTN